MRTIFLLTLALALVASGGASSATPPPSFIILLSDDHGWGDLSPPLGISPALTPNLNAIAASPDGAHFPRFYIGGSVCSPSRASILTGRTASRSCVDNVEQTPLPLQLQGTTIAEYARTKGYSTAFFGKYHLGSMSNDTTTTSCYPSSATNNTCLPGYIGHGAAPYIPTDQCCDGRDAGLTMRPPTAFGFETVFATSQVAPSSTSNCGCLQTVPGAGEGCNLGHYADAGHSPSYLPGLECDQTWQTMPDGSWAPYKEVAGVDDAAMLVDRLEAFVMTAQQQGRPFLAQVSFHQVHIPYIAPPEFRALYPDVDENHQDYYGALTAMDAQIGRIRGFLRDLGLANNTLLAFTADNGPEVDTGGHGCVAFPNPGVTNGLQGRKRALLEGGIRVPGLVEAPFLVQGKGPLRLDHYVASHVDFLPTVLDLINASNARPSWPLDGVSLAPALRGEVTVRPANMGWLANFTLESGNATCPHGPARLPSNAPANFTTPRNQAQTAWSEGPLTLVACRNFQGNYYFRLFNVETDPGQENDLFLSDPSTVEAMYSRLAVWLASVQVSRETESMCQLQPGGLFGRAVV